MKAEQLTTNKLDPKVKDVLTLLGVGIFITGSFLIPGLPLLAKPILEKNRQQETNEWGKFNAWRLKQIMKRLHAQKLVEVAETQSGYIVQITEKGKQRLLKYDLEAMALVKKKWDGKWRIVIYDVSESKKQRRRLFQKILKKLELLQLQKSVYLTPYPCENEIEYLRQIYTIGSEVVLLTVSGLENEQAYKKYFGLT